MGIPRLVTHLVPFATKVRYTAEDTKSPTPVVIDGPGLAYYAASLALHKFGRIPSYGEIGDAALLFLQDLQAHGLNVRAIYFDGFLPDYKRSERWDRMSTRVNELDKLQRTSGKGKMRDPQPRDLNTGLLTRRSPFMVPAVIEVLLDSGFRSLTEVVPGEADPWCAADARSFGSIVITNDSDLLAHDLGPRGSVILLDSMDVQEESGVSAYIYKQAEIADRLRLANLRSFACALVQSQGQVMTTNELVEKAEILESSLAPPEDLDRHGIAHLSEKSPIDKHSSLFAQNIDSYIFNQQQADFQALLSALDPRISEMIHEVVSCRYDQSRLRRLTMFLPVLSDNVARASAWRCGEHIRQLGYFIATETLLAKPESVCEIGRSGATVNSKWHPLDRNPMLISALSSDIEIWQDIFAGLPHAVVWRLYGIYSMWQDLHDIDQHFLLLRENARQVLIGDPNLSNCLVFGHVDAQLQAQLYSLRILQQAAKVYHAFPVEERNQEFDEVVTRLTESLAILPAKIFELFPQNYRVAVEEEPQIGHAIARMYERLGVEERPIVHIERENKQYPIRSRGPLIKENYKPIGGIKGLNTGNPYAVLELE